MTLDFKFPAISAITIAKMKLALIYGANVNAVNNKGNTPLLEHSRDDASVEFLSKNGALTGYQNPHTGNTIFHLIVFDTNRSIKAQTEIIKRLGASKDKKLRNHKNVVAIDYLEDEKRRLELLMPKHIDIPTKKELGIGKLYFQ